MLGSRESGPGTSISAEGGSQNVHMFDNLGFNMVKVLFQVIIADLENTDSEADILDGTTALDELESGDDFCSINRAMLTTISSGTKSVCQ